MELFDLTTPVTLPDALHAQGTFIAGGTNLIDLMKLNVERPTKLVDINTLLLTAIEPIRGANGESDGGLRIGALARNADVAHHPFVQKNYTVLSQAILAGASAQLRNMASTSGNLLQKTRCLYFRDTASPCNKRTPGSGCAAIGGVNRSLAVLGTSEHCIATNPSDQNVALAALEATIHITGTKGDRAVPIADFYLLPGNTPHKETVLEPGDLITSITLPAPKPNTRSLYLKLRDRASYEFALASAAVVVSQNTAGHIDHIRIALGGVGTRPWRSLEAEKALLGKAPTAANLRAAADAALAAAKPQSQNSYKIELAKRCLTHAITQATSA